MTSDFKLETLNFFLRGAYRRRAIVANASTDQIATKA